MSIDVPTNELATTLAEYGFAYLLTIGRESRPHVTAVFPAVEGEALRVAEIGRRTRLNLLARPEVTLVWPPKSADGYSLIVDGAGAFDGEVLVVEPARAVLHRPATPLPATDASCGSDCVEVPLVTLRTAADAAGTPHT